MTPTSESRPSLRHLPLPAKLVVTVFLISTGLGYFTALIQLHFQKATPGELMPTKADTRESYHGTLGDQAPEGEPERPISKLEMLLTASEELPFNGSGSMVPAFFEKSGSGWRRAVQEHGEEQARAMRDTERQALVEWINSGEKRHEYYDLGFPIPEELQKRPITEDFINDEGNLDIQYLVAERCLSCHIEGGEGKVSLETYQDMTPYLELPVVTESGEMMSPKRMGLTKLAQSTHAHWLTLTILFSLTGMVVAFSSYPLWLRCSLAPLVLIMQMFEISCWWLARLDGNTGLFFADMIMVAGGVVALGLCAQILLSLFDLYNLTGKAVLVLIGLAVSGGGILFKTQVIDPHIAEEKAAMAKETASEEAEAGTGDSPTSDPGD